jgi:hypothetical protein
MMVAREKQALMAAVTSPDKNSHVHHHWLVYESILAQQAPCSTQNVQFFNHSVHKPMKEKF